MIIPVHRKRLALEVLAFFINLQLLFKNIFLCSSSYAIWLTLFFVYVIYTMIPLPVIVLTATCVLLSIIHLLLSYRANPFKVRFGNQVSDTMLF